MGSVSVCMYVLCGCICLCICVVCGFMCLCCVCEHISLFGCVFIKVHLILTLER